VLRAVEEKLGVRVVPKLRIADTLKIEGSGLSHEEYSYALTAHFDWVVADAKTTLPHFAVEFDGAYHDAHPRAAERDRMKDRIADRCGLPLLRVNADYLQTVKGFPLLAWLAEVWMVKDSITAAQERGDIPDEVYFDPWSMFERGEDGTYRRKYDLAEAARLAIMKAYKDGRSAWLTPDHAHRTTADAGEGYAILRVTESEWLISYVRLRGFRFAPVLPGELALDLAVVDVAAKLEEFGRGVAVTAGGAQYDELVQKLESEDPQWSFGFASRL
jgi:hypothetical protein